MYRLANRFSFLLFFLLTTFSAAGQMRQDSITGVKDFNLDPLGNCYYLKGADIVKINSRGKELVRYSMKNIGAPSSFDVSNPMRILIFYAEFATIRILDNNLVDQSEIDLRELGLLQPRVMAGSPDQGIWVYDEIPGTLMKIDVRLNKSSFSVDLNQLMGRRPNPTLLLANQDWIILKDTREIMVFDQFGSKVKSIPFEQEPHLIQLKDNLLMINLKNELITYNLSLNAEAKTAVFCPPGCSKSLLSADKCWYILDQNLYIPQ
jgi:hypothetical protein